MEGKEYVGSYQIRQVFPMETKQFVIGVDPIVEEKYLLANRRCRLLGYEYEDVVVSGDYLEIAEELSERIHREIQKMREDRIDTRLDGMQVNRCNLLGVIDPRFIPDWVGEKADFTSGSVRRERKKNRQQVMERE